MHLNASLCLYAFFDNASRCFLIYVHEKVKKHWYWYLMVKWQGFTFVHYWYLYHCSIICRVIASQNLRPRQHIKHVVFVLNGTWFSYCTYLPFFFVSEVLIYKICNVSSYFVERGVCYLVLCEKSFSRRQAFAYLEDLQAEFTSRYGSKIDTVSRPYSFIEFGMWFFLPSSLSSSFNVCCNWLARLCGFPNSGQYVHVGVIPSFSDWYQSAAD